MHKSNSFELFEYSSIKIGNQYKKIFWSMMLFAASSIILSFIIVSLPIISHEHVALTFIVVCFPLMTCAIVRYYIFIKKKMVCPICSKGKLDLQTLEQIYGQILIFYCPICKQNYTSDLMYKQQLFSTQSYISVIKEKKIRE